jgi:hypothetical protein
MAVIRIANLNDNPPVFEKNFYRLQISEDEPIGFQVALIRAFGGDAGETIDYRIVPNTDIDDYFNLDKNGRSKG